MSFALPANIQAALRAAHPSAKLRFAMNLGGSGKAYVDHVRMGGTLGCQEPPSPLPAVASSGPLNFESTGSWGANVALTHNTSLKSQGSASVSWGASPWVALESAPFVGNALTGVTSRFAVDVYVPPGAAGVSWAGSLNAFVQCPSVGLYKTFLGNRALQVLYAGRFNRLNFDLPAHAVSALKSAAPDCKFFFEVAQNVALSPFALTLFAREWGGFVSGGAP